MNDLEIPNKEQLDAVKLPRNDLRDLKYEALIVMKLMGLKYKEIGERVGFSEGHVQKLFMSGGKLHARYEEVRATVGAKSTEDAMTILFSNLPDVARAMVVSAKMPHTPVGVMAGKTIFEHTLGKPVEKIKHDININITSTALVERVALRRKQKNGDDDSGGGGTISSGVAG